MLPGNYKIITKSKGRAGEYSELALNICVGCTHGCKYCYAAAAVRRSKESFHSNVVIKKNMEERLEKDCIKLQKLGFEGKILLSFVSDPYQPVEEVLKNTRMALGILDYYHIGFQVLTKAGTQATKDFDLYKPGDSFASTLTTLDDGKVRIWEPNAALSSDRMEALKQAHNLGIETWISLEPVIWPEDSLEIIEATHEFVGHYKIGPLNYDKEIREAIDWKTFTSKAVALLGKYGKTYYLKEELLKLIQ